MIKKNPHQHHHHELEISTMNGAFVIATVLNLSFVIVEGIAGFYSNSMGLLSDAGHNLSDTVSLLIAWIAFYMARKMCNTRFTYGYGRCTILSSLINACILMVAVGIILIESINKFIHPQPVDSEMIIWVAVIGIIINLSTALLFVKGRKNDINIKGAFIHMMMDTLVSVGVVLSGVVIYLTGWTLIDPIIGIAIALIIFVSTWNLLKESIFLSLDAVPHDVNSDEIKMKIVQIPGVINIHHLHIWALGSSRNAATLHIVIRDINSSQEIKSKTKALLQKYHIAHSTIEIEQEGYICDEINCQ